MKKVLIICYYWPPAGGPGVQRWLKFVKYLREFDIEPVVYVPENAHYPLIDKSSESEIPKGIKVIKKNIFEPYAFASLLSGSQTKTISTGIIEDEAKQGFLQKLMLYIRGNFFIPDARKFWIKPSVKFLSDFLKEENIDTVITTGPPHSVHLIGFKLKEKFNVNWLADFRDPWTNIGYHSKLKLTEKSKSKHLELERKILEAANEIIVTSYTTREEFSKKTSKPVHLITNGFDDEKIGEVQPSEDFLISHVGSLLSGRNPENLWRSLGDLVKENKDFRDHLKLEITGAISSQVKHSILAAGLEPFVSFNDYVSHNEALKIQRRSRVLLLLEIDSEETRGIIPGKLFEYLVAKRPILAVGPKDWDAARIISETSAGKSFKYYQQPEIKSYILELFNLFKNNAGTLASEDINEYHRRSLTEKLAKIIQKY
ncbi:glycosyltransferase family 4 protein [Salegentibacter sp. HM20]